MQIVFLLLTLAVVCTVLIAGHYALYRSNPYAPRTWFKSPYSTYRDNDSITYRTEYRFTVYGGRLAGLFGYYVSGFLIARNTLFGSKPTQATTEPEIISEIHRQRFDASLPYLISGDQFSVLYPRNLGVFYNQLLNPDIALDAHDWEHKQRLYLQSVLIAIDGLAAANEPRTTIVPITPTRAVVTQVHPGGIGSDQVYGLLYALHALRTPRVSANGLYSIQTIEAANRIVRERSETLRTIVMQYLGAVQDSHTGMVIENAHLASARDGVVRSGSFYDNLILWKTISLARELGIVSTPQTKIDALRRKIDTTFWNEERGFYNDDVTTHEFSSDWLIGYPTNFFDLNHTRDAQRAARIIEYIESSQLARPFPIKYQASNNHPVPWFVKRAVPSYGGDAIWSYWGAEYITLLMGMYTATQQAVYIEKAQEYQQKYAATIVRDRGFAETFDRNGNFLTTPFYKSIRITGWVVQYERAVQLLRDARLDR